MQWTSEKLCGNTAYLYIHTNGSKYNSELHKTTHLRRALHNLSLQIVGFSTPHTHTELSNAVEHLCSFCPLLSATTLWYAVLCPQNLYTFFIATLIKVMATLSPPLSPLAAHQCGSWLLKSVFRGVYKWVRLLWQSAEPPHTRTHADTHTQLDTVQHCNQLAN